MMSHLNDTKRDADQVDSVNPQFEREETRFFTLSDIIEEARHSGDGKSERILLLLSTCRNAYLTLNATFATLRLTLGQGVVPPCTEGIIYGLKNLDVKLLDRSVRDSDTGLSVLLKIAKQKLEVWDARNELYQEFLQAADRWAGSDRARRRQKEYLVADLVASPVSLEGRFLRFDIGLEPEPLPQRFTVIRSCIRTLEYLKELAQHSAKLISLTGMPLFASTGQIDTDSIRAIVQELSDTAVNLQWRPELSEDGSSLTIRAIKSGLTPVLVSAAQLGSGDQSGIQALAELVKVEVGQIRRTLATHFLPNVSDRPMPEPFLVDFTHRQPLSQVSTHRELSLKPVSFGLSPPEEVKIAIAGLPIPRTSYVHSRLNYKNAEIRRSVWSSATRTIQEASERGAAVVVFPEMFFPEIPQPDEHESLDNTLAALAKEGDIIIIGGVECREEMGKLVNEAVVAFPSDGVFRQGKQDPSPYEPPHPAFFSDGELKIFNKTRLGTFAVLICKDFMEHDIIHALEQSRYCLDFLFVLAYTPKPELFEDFARADSVRLLRHVVLVQTNSLSSLSWNSVVSPDKNDRSRMKKPPSDGKVVVGDNLFSDSNLWVVDVDRGELDTAWNTRQEPGMIYPSSYARRRRTENR